MTNIFHFLNDEDDGYNFFAEEMNNVVRVDNVPLDPAGEEDARDYAQSMMRDYNSLNYPTSDIPSGFPGMNGQHGIFNQYTGADLNSSDNDLG